MDRRNVRKPSPFCSRMAHKHPNLATETKQRGDTSRNSGILYVQTVAGTTWPQQQRHTLVLSNPKVLLYNSTDDPGIADLKGKSFVLVPPELREGLASARNLGEDRAIQSIFRPRTQAIPGLERQPVPTMSGS